MTDQKREEKRALIEYTVVKPFVDAAALGLGIGGPAAFSGKFWTGFVAGSSLSFVVYWCKANLTDPKRKTARPKGDYIATNWGSGKMRRFEQVAPGYITRQSWVLDLRDAIFGKPEAGAHPLRRSPVLPLVRKPETLQEFAFISYDKNRNEVQILDSIFMRFLDRAWRLRLNGKGLSERTWGYRGRHTWPHWYNGPYVYQSILRLLVQAQRDLDVQLIVSLGHQQIGLAMPPRETYDHVFTWYTKKG